MISRRIAVVVGALLSYSSILAAAELHVFPGQSIQAAIDSAIPGDHVVVHPGNYQEAIFFKGKAIVVRSFAGPNATTIDATGQAKRTVNFQDLESPLSVLDGFTIRGGTGGILCQTSQPTIRNCVVRENTTTGRGGGIFAAGGSVTIGPIVEDCVFEDNAASQGGGGVATQNKGITLRRCVVRGNLSSQAGGGGGVYLQGSGFATMEDCRVEDNESLVTPGGGMIVAPSSNARVTVRRTSVVGNRAVAVGGIHVVSLAVVGTNCSVDFDSILVSGNEGAGLVHVIAATENKKYCRVVNATIGGNGLAGFQAFPGNFGTSVSLRNSIVRGNGAENVVGSPTVIASNVEGGFPGDGNVDLDPLFVDATLGDYHLRYDSPCIDLGLGPEPGPLDFEGDPRVTGEAIDLGADEFQRRLYVTITKSPTFSRVRFNVLDEPGKPVLLITGFSSPAQPFDTLFGPVFVGPPYAPIVSLGTTPSSGWVMQRFDVRNDLAPFSVYAQAISGNVVTNAIAVALP